MTEPTDQFKEGMFKWGPFLVIVSKDAGRWHMSISHKRRDLTYDEIRRARYKFIPSDVAVAMVFPPPEVYVNVHEHCFHLWELRDDFPEWTQPLNASEEAIQQVAGLRKRGVVK